MTAVLILVVHFAAAADPGFGWITWGAVLLATQIGGLLTIVQILAAIVLTEGRVSRDQVRQMFGMDLVVTMTGTLIALVGGILWIERPEATPLLLIPIVGAIVGSRAYVREREDHEKADFLAEANRNLSESHEVAVALEGLLEGALEAFHAEQAEVILFAADGGAPLRISLGPGTAREALAPVDTAAAVALRTCATGSELSVDAARSLPRDARPVPPAARRPARHARRAARRGARDRHDHAREPLRARARLPRQRPRPVRDAGRQRERRAAVRPPRARRGRAARPPGAAPAPGPARPAHRARQPLPVQPAGARGARAGHAGRGRRDVHRSRRLQGRQRHAGARRRRPVAERRRLPADWAPCAARMSSRGSAATSSPSSSAARRRPSGARSSSPSARCGPSPCRSSPARSSSTSASASGSPRARSQTRAEDLLRDADVAMYDAKEGGKRRFAVFAPAMRDSIVRRHGLKAELERAIEEREIVVQYQPIVDLATGTDRLRRGPRALEPSRPRPHPAARVHPARGEHGPDRAARPLRAGGGVRARQRAPRPPPGAGEPVGDRARAARPARDDAGRPPAHRHRPRPRSCSR